MDGVEARFSSQLMKKGGSKGVFSETLYNKGEWLGCWTVPGTL